VSVADQRAAHDEASSAGGDKAPLVSVVIVTLNRWPLLGEAIESVLAQTFREFELIVIDDGSSDGTADHVRELYPTVRVFSHENAERGVSFNRGISLARGQYVAFLGDDDIFEPWHLEQFATAVEASPGTPAFASLVSLWDPATDRRQLEPGFDPKTLWHDALFGTVTPPQAWCVARSLLLDVGGFPEPRPVQGSEDWVVLLKMARRIEIQPLPRPSARIRQHPGRSMNNLRAMSDSREAACRMILDEGLLGYELDEDARRCVKIGTHRLVASHRYAAGEMREARRRCREVVRLEGWRAGGRRVGRLWIQTWLGSTGAAALRRAKNLHIGIRPRAEA